MIIYLTYNIVNNFIYILLMSSFHQRLTQKRQRVLNREDLIGLSPQQRQFAEEQFRLIYAQQMSKLTSQLSHKKKIQQNLNNLDQMQSKNLKEQYDKLKTRMAEIQEKRNKKLQQKVKTYKQNDQRWFNKLKQIQSKFKRQNRQAMEKAQKYRQESQNYWKSKEKKMQEISKTNFENSRTRKYETQTLNRSFVEGSKKFNQIGAGEKRMTLNYEGYQGKHRIKHMSKPQIDTQIKIHQQKSDYLQQQRQMIIFQKAMEKMQKIEQKREKITKQKQSKVSQPTKPKVVDSSHHSSTKKKQKQKHQYSSSMTKQGRTKQSLQKLIKDHLYVKQKLEQQSFNERGQLLETVAQKNRKDRIIRMVKSKVHQMKVSALMKQGSKNSLIL